MKEATATTTRRPRQPRQKAVTQQLPTIEPEVLTTSEVTLKISSANWELMEWYGKKFLKGSSPQYICLAAINRFCKTEIEPAHDKLNHAPEPEPALAANGRR